MDLWQPLIAAAAKRFGIPAMWILAVMRAESGGRATLDGRPITSSAGAMGVMQVMPETYREMRQRLSLGADPYDPHDNIFAGAAYLRDMYERFGYPALFAAYNAGPAAFQA
jgi:soluble lytic murein transglycosylase-like protein